MKRKHAFLLILLAMLTLLTPLAYAEDSSAAAVETFEDHLEFNDEVKWYEFEMTEAGGAVIFIEGLQERWDGYTYHWRCKVYEANMESVITYGDVRGYTSQYSKATTISLPDLEAGTYYLQMTSVNYTNPLMTTFTSDPYRISLVRSYHSAAAVYDGDGVQAFQQSGAVLWSLDGTKFLKLNDGECLGALTSTSYGAVVPLLVSTDEEAVEYLVTSTGERIGATGPYHDEASGLDYYYSDCRYISQYATETVDTSSLPITYISIGKKGMGSAVESLIAIREAELRRKKAERKEAENQLTQGESSSTKDSWLKEHQGTVIIIGLVLLGLLILGSIPANKNKRGKTAAPSHSRSRSYNPRENWGSYSPVEPPRRVEGCPDYNPEELSDPPVVFDPSDYVHENCTSQIYGLVTERDLEAIERDPYLTYEQKEEAKRELEHQATMYY